MSSKIKMFYERSWDLSFFIDFYSISESVVIIGCGLLYSFSEYTRKISL